MPKKSTLKLPQLNLCSEPIGQRIARFRKEKGLTQQELAHIMGLVQYLISDYETGRLRLYDEMVARFAIALEVSTDEILGLKKEKHLEAAPSLKIIKRLKKLEKLPPNKQKPILRVLDALIKDTGQ
ncbi:unnamed protein product [marine sediment metagenome]|uniref:HTH cro/C1-type domain-containing protein n=1 Tax=marine sediment metagenome TaxID=412755 RepID=X0ZZQ1_9ZZZZ